MFARAGETNVLGKQQDERNRRHRPRAAWICLSAMLSPGAKGTSTEERRNDDEVGGQPYLASCAAPPAATGWLRPGA
jgi:hypothetical protein